MFNTLPYNSFPASTVKFEEGKNDAIQAEIDAMKDGTNIDSFGDVETALALKANSADMENALATKTNLSNIAPTFDATSGVYEIGDQVIYEGVLYEFTSAHSTAGDWDSSEVQAVKISELIDTLKSGLTKIKYARGRATVQNGYFTLTNVGTSLTSGVVISLMRNDAEGDAYSGLSVYTAITTANEVIVYVRKADGTSPENGTTVSYSYVAFN